MWVASSLATASRRFLPSRSFPLSVSSGKTLRTERTTPLQTPALLSLPLATLHGKARREGGGHRWRSSGTKWVQWEFWR